VSKKRITSIEIHMHSGGLCSPEEILAEKVFVYRSGKIKHKLFNGLSEIAIQEFEYKVRKLDVEDFFIYIATKIKIEEWKSDYSEQVCDGWYWFFKIRYSNHQVTNISGTIESPPNAKQLVKKIKKLTKFEVDPWIF